MTDKQRQPWWTQEGARVKLEWGAGAAFQVPATYAVVVDVLCFTTTVSVACDQGSSVLPYPIDPTASEYAADHDAVAAVRRSQARREGRLSVSPETWREIDEEEIPERVLLPSGNGSTIAHELTDNSAIVVAGCLRNRTAVADWLAKRLDEDPTATVIMVPAGEQWPDGAGLRIAVEDLLGAGAIVARLRDAGLACSVEALAAAAVWDRVGSEHLERVLADCGSGRELIARGYPADVDIAAELDSSRSVPVFSDDAFTNALEDA